MNLDPHVHEGLIHEQEIALAGLRELKETGPRFLTRQETLDEEKVIEVAN